MKNWLRAQPEQPTTIQRLQALIDQFATEYNQHRPHHSLPHHTTPATVYAARPKAIHGTDRSADTHDRVSKTGNITLRHNGRLHHIGIGRTYTATYVLLLVEDPQIRIINAATGELIRELTLDPTRDYQPTSRPPGPQKRTTGPTKP